MKRNHRRGYIRKVLSFCLAILILTMPAQGQEGSATATPVVTEAPATDTPAPKPTDPPAVPSSAASETPKNSNSETQTSTPPESTTENTAAPTAQATATNSPVPTGTQTPTDTPTPDSSQAPTDTPVPDGSQTPTDTPTPGSSQTPADSQTPGTSQTPTPSATGELPLEPSVSPEGSAEPVEQRIITAFAPLELSAYTIESKLSLAEVLSRLPETLTVNFDDGTTGSVPVQWTCPDYETRDDGDFIFTASLTTSDYLVNESVMLPQFTLTVEIGLVLSDSNYEGILNEEGELIITAWLGNDVELVVPEKIDEYAVTGIAAEVFMNRSELIRVELPKGLKTLGDRAFAGCEKLEAVVLPDSLESAGTDLFKDSPELQSIILRTDLNSRLTAPDAIEHADEDERFNVKISSAFTDIQVNAGSFTLDCDFSVGKEHVVSVTGGASMHVAAGKTLINLGTIANAGTLTNAGTIINCAGVYSGNNGQNQEGGVYTAEHHWVDDVCTVCGTAKSTEVTALEIRYVGDALSKTYDKTRNISLKASDFSISGIAAGHDVQISDIKAAYDSANAGSRMVKVRFTLSGADAALYTAGDLSIPAAIKPRTLTITPTPNQSKTFGAADPKYYTGKVKGLLSGDTLTGRLSREKGEDAGRYRIVQGTINGGDNYAIHVVEQYYTIEPKSINSSDVGLSNIGNQRYTGSAVMPMVSMRLGNAELVDGIDFTVRYSNNVQPGTATVRVCGIGNFSGERTTTFRILKVSSGIDYSGGSFEGSSGSGAGAYNYGGFYGDFDGDTLEGPDMPDMIEEVGQLTLDGEDYGVLLFNDIDEARPFMYMEEEISPGAWRLRIQPDPATHEYTGETLYLNDGRERYEPLHLRLSMEVIQKLTAAGYTEIVYELEDAELQVPLAGLLETVEVPSTDPEATEGNLVQVQSYDICIEQIEPQTLSASESAALNGYVQISQPYRLSIFAENSAMDEQGNEIVDAYSAAGQIGNLQLRIHMLDNQADNAEQCLLAVVDSDPDMSEDDAVYYEECALTHNGDDKYGTWVPMNNGLYILLDNN